MIKNIIKNPFSFAFILLIFSFISSTLPIQTYAESIPITITSTSKTLKLNMTGDDVKTLQIYLNTHSFPLALSGVGSKGHETTTFGPLTKKAVILFQKANNLIPDGIVGPLTKKYINGDSIPNVVSKSPAGCNENTTFSLTTGLLCNTSIKPQYVIYINHNVFYTLTYTAGSNGTLTGDLSQKVEQKNHGTMVSAVPNTGYHFVNWSDGITTINRTDTNVTANISVTANFAVDETTYTLTYTPGAHGSITGVLSQTVNSGIDGTEVTAVPEVGYHFVNWSDLSTTNPRTDTNVLENKSVTANFAIDISDTFTLTINTAGTGSGTTTGTGTYDTGTVVSITATQNEGSTFTSWSGDEDCSDGSVTVDANKTCTATFAIDTHTITFDKNTGDTDADPTTRIADYNTTVTLPIAPTKTGSAFDSWNTQADGNGDTFTASTAVTDNLIVYAKWTAITPITAIGVITGTTTTGSVLTAGVLTPSEATVTYQWQSATTSGGTYTDISSATGNTYTLVSTDLGNYIKVSVTGTGSYSGTVTSTATAVILGNVTFTYNTNTVTYGTVQNPITGKIWLDRNLGASQVAGSSTDSLAYGDLFQWGRADDGHQARGSATTSTLATSDDTTGNAFFILSPTTPFDWRSDNNNNRWNATPIVNNVCPTGFRIPLDTELDAERTSWSSNNSTGAFASPLKFTVAGYRNNSSGSFTNVGVTGFYWSSSIAGTNSRYLNFTSSNANMSSFYRATGRSVRCLKD